VCTYEQIDSQWPHRSGFKVVDLLQQLVQCEAIRVDINPLNANAANAVESVKVEQVRRKLIPVEPKKKREPEKKPRQPTVSAPIEVVKDDGPGADMSTHDDDLPEMIDPLYNAPKAEKPAPKKRRKASKPAPAPEPEVEEEDEAPSGSGIDLPDPIAPAASRRREPKHQDTFASAVKMAFIGAGQGGGRIAQSFYDMGYRRVCAVNTTNQDLASLTIPAKLVIGNNRGGAGKDPEQGKLAAKESYEDIMDLMMRSWGEQVEQMFVCVGGGGGSGTGSWPVIVKAMKEYGEATNIEKPITQSLGIIMTMPKRSEGSRVQANALTAVQQAVELVEAKKISTLIIVDNAKIHELYPRLSVKKFWRTANTNFAAILHTFNLLASKDSEYNTFDRADFRSVMRNGILIFGATLVEEWEETEDVSQAVRQNLAGSLLADGFDVSKATMAGAIVVAHDDVLEEIPMENIDYAFNSLGRALGNEGITLHSGIYEGRQAGMRVFTIVSGLEPPQGRMAELEKLAT
jgi:cell division protein FtsZ